MTKWLITNALVVNEGRIDESDVRIKRGRIEQIGSDLSGGMGETVFDARGRYLFPGMIDTRVRFREPGTGRRGNLASESRAAVAGGVTSCLDLPNATPPTTTRAALADKMSRAAGRSTANFSFFIGATADNLAEIIALEAGSACGISLDLAPATDELEFGDLAALERLFETAPLVISAQCEDPERIEAELDRARTRFGHDIPPAAHSDIRSREACVVAARRIIDLAKALGTRLHLTSLSTAEEVELLDGGPMQSRQISAGVSLPHLYFIDADYEELGHRIKLNPAIKTGDDRNHLRKALADGQIDMIASDHAPQLLRFKSPPYEQVASGVPTIQHALPVAWSMVAARALSPARLVEAIAHNPARRFGLAERGFVREGFHADLTLIDPRVRTDVDRQALHSQCGWTPFAGRKLPATVAATWVNGRLVWRDGLLTGLVPGERLIFDRSASA